MRAELAHTIYNNILELESEDGINASGKDEIYGCIFGRDSAITILKILKAVSNPSFSQAFEREKLLAMSRKTLLTLISLQGKETNIESGEQPGKFIHEYRKEKYEHLVNSSHPWYLYPDGIMRNYDSVDATPLGLIAIHKYWTVSQDDSFLLQALPAVEKGLNWIISYGDMDKDQLIEYEFHKDRKSGGLVVQSWTDSQESMKDKEGNMPMYPIAPVEAQGYAWLALKLWADYYANMDKNALNSQTFSQRLNSTASQMKERFNDAFMMEDNGFAYAAQALDGVKRQIKTVTGNPLLLLWASVGNNWNAESIVHASYVPDLVERAFMPDMFDPDGGLRTMSMLSPTFNPGLDSYHNGSFWPKLNGMAYEGLAKWGYFDEAQQLKEATLKPIEYFGSPIELYIKTDTGYAEYRNSSGQVSCRNQAWSAATALDMLTE